jgi:hypothetical protein
MLAAVQAMEALPDGWHGTLYTDSQVTLLRLTSGRSFNGIPDALVARLRAAQARLGRYGVVLVGGHPTRAELHAGFRKDGLPVSWHNVFVDRLCRDLAQSVLSKVRKVTA